MKISTYCIAVVTLLLFFSCRKRDQEAVTALDGRWDVGRVTTPEGDVEINELPLSVAFVGCTVDKMNCRGDWVAADSSTFFFFYKITDKGKTLILGAEEPGDSQEKMAFEDVARFGGVWNIEMLEENFLHITSDQCSGCYGEFSMKLIKQKSE